MEVRIEHGMERRVFTGTSKIKIDLGEGLVYEIVRGDSPQTKGIIIKRSNGEYLSMKIRNNSGLYIYKEGRS